MTESKSTQPLLATEQAAVQQLPDLTDRLQRLGLMEEYSAFKKGYLAFRRGNARGAKGEVTHDQITRDENLAVNRGFGFQYPTVQEWLWRRTISYWISVSFFEGSIYFAFSSFFFNYSKEMGEFYTALTLCGYLAGKVCFFVGCYFMCLEIINLEIDGEGTGTEPSPQGSPVSVHNSLVPSSDFTFYLWPYRYSIAFEKLRRVGAGPVPYYAAFLYLTGVGFFTVGVAAKVTPGLEKGLEAGIEHYSFMFGSLLFFLGGICECVQNSVFTTCSMNKGWWGALFNGLGGTFFFGGSLLGFVDPWNSNCVYGYGSLLYVVGSSIQVVMWKDDQFGLTFLGVLNNLGKPGGITTLTDGPADSDSSRSTFSMWGAFMVHVYCWLGAMSTYNLNLELAVFFQSETSRSFQYAFNEFLPCMFAHLMLALNSAVLRTPKVAPFRQLYQMSRMLGLILAVNSTYTFYMFVSHQIKQ